MKLVSIIVPAYNVEAYLPECLDSLLAQSYENIEILLIDDGSTDNSGAIADEYAKRDHRITVFHQENQGISAARNRGLDAMHGDYVMFVDGDDIVDKNYCQDALYLAIEHHVDIVVFGFCPFWGQIDETESKATRVPRLLSKEDAIRELIRRRDVLYNYVWNKIFKSSLFKDIRFTVGLTFEDVAIMHWIFHLASTGIYLSDRVLYYYRKNRPGSIVHSLRSSKSIHNRLQGELERLVFIKDHYPELERIQFGPLVEVCFQGLTLLPSNHEDRKVIKRFLDSNKEKCLSATYAERRKRLWAYYYMKPLFYLTTLYVRKHYYADAV